MALPFILTPAGTPPFRVSDHAIKPDEVFASIVYRTGHNRLRRLYVGSVPRIATVSWELSATQMAIVDDWAETTLEAYTRHFTAQIANITGTGVLYYDANWVEPYTAEPMDGGRWVVTGSLYLTGEGETDPPITSLFRSELFVPFTGSAFVQAEKHFAVEISVFFSALQQLRMELAVAVKDFNTPEPPPPPPAPPPAPPPVPFGLFLRPVALLDSGATLLATSFEQLSDSTISRAFTTTDGINYKQLETLADPTLPISFPDGVHHWDAVIGNTILSLGLNVNSNFAGQIISNTDPEDVAPSYGKNDNTSEDFFTTGYPRTTGGVPIATGALYTDATTYFYIVGRLANQSQPTHNMYLYRAGTDAVFTQLGQITKNPSDPNAIADGNFGSFQSEWFCLSSTVSTTYDLTSDLKKFGSRYFLISTFAVYYTDDSSLLTNWTRAPLGFGEETRTNPPVNIITVVKAGSYLIAIDGSVPLANPTVSVSTDNGSTWAATTQSAMQGVLAQLRQTVVLGSRVFSYYIDGSSVGVAYADAPYTSWAVTSTTGLAAGHLLSDNYFEAFGGMVAATDHDELVFTVDGIHFEPSILINYYAREVDLLASPSDEKNRMLRQDGIGWFKRENYGL